MATQETIAVAQIEKQRLGYLALSFDGIRSASAVGVATGSKLEIGGSLFYVSASETPSGFTAITTGATAIVYAVVDGSGSTATVHFEYSETQPVWSSVLQGFYAGTNRAIGHCYKTGTTEQRGVTSYDNLKFDNPRILFNGSIAVGNFECYYGNNGLLLMRSLTKIYFLDSGTYEDLYCGIQETPKGCLFGSNGKIIRTITGGSTWADASTSVTSDIVYAHVMDDSGAGNNWGAAFTVDGRALTTTDCGSTFTVVRAI